MAGKSTTLVIRILADASQAAKTMSGTGTKLAGGLQKAAIPAGLVMAGLGAMGKAAADDAKGQALLAKSLQNTAGATKAQLAATEDWITKTTLATGVADDQLRPALSTLARATGDVETSQKAMATVLDVSAATGKDAESVASAVAKAYAGNTTSLGKMVPGMDKAILKSGDMTKIMEELARMTGGSAATAADTAAGKWDRAQVAFNETKESIGGALLPMLSKVGESLATFGKWASENTKVVTALAIAIGVVAAAVLAVNVALKVYAAGQKIVMAAQKIWTAIQWLWNAAMAANPIGIIIIAIIALVAAIVIAYKKSATFRAIVQGAFKGITIAAKAVARAFVVAWNAIKRAVGAVWNWLKANVFAPIVAYYTALWKGAGKAVDLVVAAWEGLKSGLGAVWDWLKSNVFGPLKTAFDNVVDAVKGVIDWIKKIKIPAPVQKLIDMGKSLFMVPPGVAVAPAPHVGPRSAGLRAGARTATTGDATGRSALDALTTPEVIVQVSDRKMAQLVDVSIRASATSAARNLTRRRVVTV